MALVGKTINLKYYLYGIQGDNYLVSFPENGIKQNKLISFANAEKWHKRDIEEQKEQISPKYKAKGKYGSTVRERLVKRVREMQQEWRKKVFLTPYLITQNYDLHRWKNDWKSPDAVMKIVHTENITISNPVYIQNSGAFSIKRGIEKARLELMKKIKRQEESQVMTWTFKAFTAKAITKDEVIQRSQNPEVIKMFRQMPAEYLFLKGGALNPAPVNGNCVIDFLIKEYPDQNLTKEKLVKIMAEDKVIIDDCYDPNETIWHNGEWIKRDLIDIVEDEPVIIPEGYDTKQILKFCKHYKISMYALDIKSHVFSKYISPKKNRKALIFYSADSHLYPVTDKGVRKSIQSSEGNKDRLKKNGEGFEIKMKEKDEIDDRSERFKLPSFVDIDIKELDKYDNCNIFYNLPHLETILLDLFLLNNKQYLSYTNGEHITKIKYNDTVFLFSNINYSMVVNNKRLDWNDSIAICKDFNVPYTNQSIVGVTNNFYQTSFNGKGVRLHLRERTPELEIDFILMDQEEKCKDCQSEFNDTTNKYEIDHKISLGQGGDNSPANLQALCVPCHKAKSALEQFERKFKIDNSRSSFNAGTKAIFTQKRGGFMHTYDLKKNKKKVPMVYKGLDMNKCYKNVMRYNTYRYPVYSKLDDIKPFVPFIIKKNKAGVVVRTIDTKIEIGNYYVVTNEFRGCDWYCEALVKFALENTIFKQTDIKYYAKPSLSLPANYYNDFIDSVYSKSPNYLKIAINGFVGSLGHKVKKTKQVWFVRSFHQVSNLVMNSKNKLLIDYTIINDKSDENGQLLENKDPIYKVTESSQEYIDDSYVPIHDMILDLALIELYKTKKLLESYGGEVAYINTDNVVCRFKGNNEFTDDKWKNIFWDPENKLPKYKRQDEFKEKDYKEQCKKDTFHFTKQEYQTVTDADLFDKWDFAPLVKEMMGKSFQMQARGGCGKTFYINEFIKVLTSMNKKYICLTPTHKANKVMMNGAITIDSFFMKYTKKSLAILKNISYIIIDEKSMMKELFISQLYSVSKLLPDLNFIICGDWNQFKPVLDRSKDFAYEGSSAIFDICKGNMLELTQCRRADDELFNKTDPKNISNINVEDFKHKEREVSISFYNSTRLRINKMWMNRKKPINCEMVEKDPKNKKSQDIFLYEGLPLICVRTNSQYNMKNCDEFKITQVNDKTITIQDIDNQDLKTIDKKDITMIFQPSYCITSHKYQGSTIKTKYSIYDWNKMTHRAKYVSLTRGTKLKNINIIM